MVEHFLILEIMNTKNKGELSEGVILAKLLLSGKTVLQPFGDNQRYDLVVDEGGHFIRIQCKTGRIRKGVVVFNTCSNHEHRGRPSRPYYGEADMFAVFVPETEVLYMMPVAEAPPTKGHLRLETPKNGQSKNVKLAEIYEYKSGSLLDRLP